MKDGWWEDGRRRVIEIFAKEREGRYTKKKKEDSEGGKRVVAEGYQ